MERRLYLVRHAHAEAEAPRDAERPLSGKGRRQARRLVEGFARNGLLRPDAFWHSGYRRARETAEILKEGLKLEPPLAVAEGLTPYDPPEDVAARLDALDASVCLFGHEPHLSCLGSILLGGVAIDMPKAAVLCLFRIQAGASRSPWQLAWHVSHRHYK